MAYAIFNKIGNQICIQYADSPRQAVEFARMYGHRAVWASAIN